MKKSLRIVATIFVVICGSILGSFETAEKASAQSSLNDLVVHEWGTFTSVSGKNGLALDWRPLNGASDLPSFVYSLDGTGGYRQTHEVVFNAPSKGNIIAKVRMETPVIYFYTKKSMEVSVNVDFPRGAITEWYPQAAYVNASVGTGRTAKFVNNGINWGKIRLIPDENPDFLREAVESHYYPARETDAVPVEVCNADRTRIEREKFLFYRGVGDFDLPLTTRLESEKIFLNLGKTQTGAPGPTITNLIVFENRGGRIGFELVSSVSSETVVVRPAVNKNLAQVFAELEKTLVAQGLFEKEAKSMIATWKDSWFEEGLRVFYILPRKATDEILPLTVKPRPRKTVRVLVGRAEIITPEMESDVRKQVGLLSSTSAKNREEAQNYLKKYERFIEPVLKSLLSGETDTGVRAQIEKLLETN